MHTKHSANSKLRSTGIPEQAAATALELFGGKRSTPVSFAGRPYPTSDSMQLKIDGEELGYGNCAPYPALFSCARSLHQTAAPHQSFPEKAFCANRFSFSCGNADIVATALQVILSLIKQREVKKFIITVKNAAERESIRLSLTALCAYFANVYGMDAPVVTIYNSDYREDIRRFVCSNTGHILLINRENFDKQINLLRRPYAPFSDASPLSLLSAGYPVVITISRDSGELIRLMEHLPQFNPLCTLSFLTHTDETGITVPIFQPDGKVNPMSSGEDTSMQLQFT